MPVRPALLITGIVSPYRREPFRLLAREWPLEVAAYRDAGPRVAGLTVHEVGQAHAVAMAGSGRYGAVICGLGGRVALPGSFLAARARRIPFVLWATIWSHPRTPAHALSWPLTRELYARADAVATYGPHVSRYVERHRRGRGAIVEAPQAVDVEHFGAAVPAAEREQWRARAGAPQEDDVLVLFAGRLEPEKGVPVLIRAWPAARQAAAGRLRLAAAGTGSLAGDLAAAVPEAQLLGHVTEHDLPALYAAADVLVLPSVRTATFTEPWGLVVNEAMLQRTPVITSDAVGAAAGGLVRDGRNGFVVAAGDARALATRLAALAGDAGLRERMGAAGRGDAKRLDPAAWAAGMGRALAMVRPPELRGGC